MYYLDDNDYINNYVYYTNTIVINDKIIPNNKNYIYFCEDLEYNIINPYTYIYLISNVYNKDIILWVEAKDLSIIPIEKQNILELLYGCKQRK